MYSPVVTSDTLQEKIINIQNSHRMTGANIILGDFNSYVGHMKHAPHLNALDQGIWGPIRGDSSPLHTPFAYLAIKMLTRGKMAQESPRVS